MNAFLLVGLGGALGAIARYGSGVLTGRFWPSAFPIVTLSINVLGSLLMGLLIGALARFTPAWQAEARLFLAIGVLGGFTTFSSFSLDTIALIERGEIGQALLYVGLSVVLSLGALALGLVVMRGVPA
ncbi:camphor resistance protein CrcB [Devosia enhydra]|uniref:Fluoride-specific ion channel FluC n=1 Tax=Devosia enhydra TaxID=665118 RepID=A0A1K2HTB2_9HYPH|nr:fluoride efflux transporter CrcB [Devosia enhydra]SFZ81153.1 camphor resistance protein CrcB [Devosia enhydra]